MKNVIKPFSLKPHKKSTGCMSFEVDIEGLQSSNLKPAAYVVTWEGLGERSQYLVKPDPPQTLMRMCDGHTEDKLRRWGFIP